MKLIIPVKFVLNL